MSSSFPYYRPDLKITTQAAFSQLPLSDQVVHESIQLTLCRDALEKTLLIVRPESQLALKLQDCLNEIRRRLLSMLAEDHSGDRYSDLRPHPSPAPISDDHGHEHASNMSRSSPEFPNATTDWEISTSSIQVEVGNETNDDMVSSVLRALAHKGQDEYIGNEVPTSQYRGRKRSSNSTAEAVPASKRQKLAFE
jgi:hypothetical protein